jgi:hypothetical protein
VLPNHRPSVMTGQVITEELNEFRMSPYYWHLTPQMVLTTLLPTSKMESSVMPHYIPFSDGALIDCGDIGGVAREDARVIFKDTLPRAILTDDVVRPYGCRPY